MGLWVRPRAKIRVFFLHITRPFGECCFLLSSESKNTLFYSTPNSLTDKADEYFFFLYIFKIFRSYSIIAQIAYKIPFMRHLLNWLNTFGVHSIEMERAYVRAMHLLSLRFLSGFSQFQTFEIILQARKQWTSERCILNQYVHRIEFIDDFRFRYESLNRAPNSAPYEKRCHNEILASCARDATLTAQRETERKRKIALNRITRIFSLFNAIIDTVKF